MDHTALYRNHPFFAGMISLDVSVNISLFLSTVTIPHTNLIHRTVHQYNAMVRGEDMKLVLAIEKFLDIHSKAFFSPTRPSHNFLISFEKNCRGINEKTASQLYRVLIEKDMSGMTDTSFPALVKSVQKIWKKYFSDTNLLGFNFIAFEEALLPIVNEVHALVPEQETWERCVIGFLDLFDRQIDPPMCKQAANTFSRLARKLSTVMFDLLPRVSQSMHEALYGPLPSLVYSEDESVAYPLFGNIMSILEDEPGPLARDEIAYIFKTSRENPMILGLYDLVAGGPDKISSLNHVGAGPRADTELLECLMQVDVNCIYRRPGPPEPFHACAATGNLENLKLLLSAYNYFARDRQCEWKGNTALHYAAMHGHLEVVKFLVSLFVDPDIINNDGKKPIDLAMSPAI